jgi:HAD superfamily hydrolase (TIGR01509 family)
MPTIQAPTGVPFSPHNTVFAFDLHGVVLTYHYTKIIRLFLRSSKKITLLRSLINIRLWRDTIKLIYNNAIAEEYLVGLGNKYPQLAPYVPLGISIANAQKPIKKTINLIKKLKRKGYTIHLFSNIGSTVFADLHVKQPDIVALFDNAITPSPTNNYLRKPNQQAFINYQEMLNANKKQVIFIDNKLSNVRAGKASGMLSIYFTNPGKLKHALTTLKIL